MKQQQKGVSYKRNWKSFVLNFFVNTSQYLGGILAYFALAIPVFNNTYDDKSTTELSSTISSYSFKCQYLVFLCTRLYGLLEDVSSIFGNARRVYELYDHLQIIENKSGNQTRLDNTNRPNFNDDICFSTKSLSIMTPKKQSRILVNDLNIKFIKNQNILITGRSGCGKTSLFRCINSLWECYTGEIHINQRLNLKNPKEIFFLPQTSYFTMGSLLEQIIYPIEVTNELKVDQNKLIQWLKLLNLEHLLEMVNSNFKYKPSFTWSSVLSTGLSTF
jgi:ABC-type uncharacterized transport system fused permease/ATPase subunit